MADLNETQSTAMTKLIGSDSSGLEQTPIASLGAALRTSDVSTNGGTQAAITVGTSAIEVKVGVSVLTNRKFVTVFNNSTSIIYWGYTNAVTTANGTPLFKNQERGFCVGPGTTIWLIAGGAGNNVRITERA